MKTRTTRSVPAGLAALLLACSTVSVSQDYDPTADFSALHTFAWLSHQPPQTGDPRADNPLIHDRITAAIENTLQSRGYRKATGEPDFYVGYHLSFENKLDVYTVNTHYGYGAYGRYGAWGTVGFPETRTREYEQGTLIIDIADGPQKKLVWRGTGTRRVSRNLEPAKVTERVNAAVAEILAQFPPR